MTPTTAPAAEHTLSPEAVAYYLPGAVKFTTQLVIDRIAAAALRSKRTDAALADVATYGVPGDLCNDQATAALALLRARQGKLDEMHPAHVERAAITLAELNA